MRSCRSWQKNDSERIAPVALYKRANMSNSLLLLMTKERWDRERFALFHERITILFFRSQKTSNSLKKKEELIPRADKYFYGIFKSATACILDYKYLVDLLDPGGHGCWVWIYI